MRGTFLPAWSIALPCLIVTAALYASFLLVRGPLPEPPYLKIPGSGFIFNYRVDLQLLAPQSREVFWQHAFAIRSQVSDNVMPDKPLTVGPGYQRP